MVGQRRGAQRSAEAPSIMTTPYFCCCTHAELRLPLVRHYTRIAPGSSYMDCEPTAEEPSEHQYHY